MSEEEALAGVKRKIARRVELRNQLWPDAEAHVFHSRTGGWARMPRTVPMIASLLDHIGGRASPGRAYLVLWSRDFGDGFVELADPTVLAMEAGYWTARGERTFAERVALLEHLAFIKTAMRGTRQHGYVLLRDPHRSIEELWKRSPQDVPASWRSAFLARCQEAGVRGPKFG